eukprot:g6619.t1
MTADTITQLRPNKQLPALVATTHAPVSSKHSPPVELPSSNAQNFFEEAKVTEADKAELRRKFLRFATTEVVQQLHAKNDAAAGVGKNTPPPTSTQPVLTLQSFCRLLQYYEACSAEAYEGFFHAMDRNRDGCLHFEEFFLGSCAADPGTVHILNSFTGYERSQYIFDYYDTNRNALLEFAEFARLANETAAGAVVPAAAAAGAAPGTTGGSSATGTSCALVAARKLAVEKARELGLLEEDARGEEAEGGGKEAVFATLQFKRFYELIHAEQLRGTSRLFRFHKSILKPRRRTEKPPVEPLRDLKLVSGVTASCSKSTTASTSSSSTALEQFDYDMWEQFLVQMEVPQEFVDNCKELQLEVETAADLEAKKRRENPALRPYPESGVFDRQGTAHPPGAAPPRIDLHAKATPLAQLIVSQLFNNCNEVELATKNSCVGHSLPPSLLNLKAQQMEEITMHALKLFESEATVIRPAHNLPTKIFGSLYGQLLDLLSFFQAFGFPLPDFSLGDLGYTQYVFLGDYVDRGKWQVELVAVLFSLKILCPSNVILLRGFHENRHVNGSCGFRSALDAKFGEPHGGRLFDLINRAFEQMSLAAFLPSGFLCLPSGVVPSLKQLGQLQALAKPIVLPPAAWDTTLLSSTQQSGANAEVLAEMFSPAWLARATPQAQGQYSTVEKDEDVVARFLRECPAVAAVIRSRGQIPEFGMSYATVEGPAIGSVGPAADGEVAATGVRPDSASSLQQFAKIVKEARTRLYRPSELREQRGHLVPILWRSWSLANFTPAQWDRALAVFESVAGGGGRSEVTEHAVQGWLVHTGKVKSKKAQRWARAFTCFSRNGSSITAADFLWGIIAACPAVTLAADQSGAASTCKSSFAVLARAGFLLRLYENEAEHPWGGGVLRREDLDVAMLVSMKVDPEGAFRFTVF